MQVDNNDGFILNTEGEVIIKRGRPKRRQIETKGEETDIPL